MSTEQPKWKLVAQLGDVHPIDYGGLFVYIDETGVYPPEAEKLIVIDEDSDHPRWETRRFILEDLKAVEFEGRTLLIPARYDETWSHPLQTYDEWFNKGLGDVARTIGTPVEQLRGNFVSTDASVRARAWEALGEYYGWDDLDSDPRLFSSRAEVEKRYEGEL